MTSTEEPEGGGKEIGAGNLPLKGLQKHCPLMPYSDRTHEPYKPSDLLLPAHSEDGLVFGQGTDHERLRQLRAGVGPTDRARRWLRELPLEHFGINEMAFDVPGAVPITRMSSPSTTA